MRPFSGGSSSVRSGPGSRLGSPLRPSSATTRFVAAGGAAGLQLGLQERA